MGFVNINGNQVHTSNLTTSNLSGTSSTSGWTCGTFISGTFSTYGSLTTSRTSGMTYSLYNISPTKSSYHILGEDVEVDGYKDSYISLIIATINVLGKPYYDELNKQNINLPKEIVSYFDNKFIILERDRKIDSVINIDSNKI